MSVSFRWDHSGTTSDSMHGRQRLWRINEHQAVTCPGEQVVPSSSSASLLGAWAGVAAAARAWAVRDVLSRSSGRRGKVSAVLTGTDSLVTAVGRAVLVARENITAGALSISE